MIFSLLLEHIGKKTSLILNVFGFKAQITNILIKPLLPNGLPQDQGFYCKYNCSQILFLDVAL